MGEGVDQAVPCPVFRSGWRLSLCSHHHHQIHDRGWILGRTDDGGLQLTAPGGRTLIRPPPPPLQPLPPKPVTDPLDVAAIRARAGALAVAFA